MTTPELLKRLDEVIEQEEPVTNHMKLLLSELAEVIYLPIERNEGDGAA